MPDPTYLLHSPVSEAELDLEFLHEGSWHTSTSSLALPIQDPDIVNLGNLNRGSIVGCLQQLPTPQHKNQKLTQLLFSTRKSTSIPMP